MTGYDIYKKSAVRLGISGRTEDISSDAGLLSSALEFINQIALDLNLEEIKNLSDEININSEKIEALCCGVTMLLSLAEGESEKNQVYTNIYNAKRAAVLKSKNIVEDILPVTESGDY